MSRCQVMSVCMECEMFLIGFECILLTRPGGVFLVNACCLCLNQTVNLLWRSLSLACLHFLLILFFLQLDSPYIKACVLLLQGSEGDVRWHCAMLDVLSALLRLCGSCRAIAVASLAAAGHAPAAQPPQASGIPLTAFCEYYF